MAVTQSFIDGQSVASPQVYDNTDPSTGRSLGPVARGGADEVDRAVTSARAASRAWRTTAPADRARVLIRIADTLERRQDRLAALESEDTGKPLTQARTDAAVAARYFRFYGHAVDTYYGHTIPLTTDLHAYTRREPLGVTGHILAWNYPMQLFSRAGAPAIATGDCAVVKPAHETPCTAVFLPNWRSKPACRRRAERGDRHRRGGRCGTSAHPGVDHIGFVGSTTVGSLVAHAAAERVAPATLELGGKSPQIVFPDADLNRATEFIAKAILQNAGQTCSAGSRLLVHESIHDPLVQLVIERFAKVTIGPGPEDEDLGPLISRKQQRRVEQFILDNDKVKSSAVERLRKMCN